MAENEVEVFTTLPPVAKSIFIFCKKCDANRFQTVLAHKTEKSASVKCEVCKAKSTFKLAGPKAPRKLSGAVAKRRADNQATRKNAHLTEYNALASSMKGEAQVYSMKNKFGNHSGIKHPKFGLGYVKTSMPEKVEVVFEDEVRLLVHNRNQ